MAKIEVDNKSPVILITTLLLLVVFVFSFCLKLIVKLLRKASFTAQDDVLLALALVSLPSGFDRQHTQLTYRSQALAIAQSIVQCVRTDNGFGKPFNELSSSKANTALKVSASLRHCCDHRS